MAKKKYRLANMLNQTKCPAFPHVTPSQTVKLHFNSKFYYFGCTLHIKIAHDSRSRIGLYL